MIMFKLSSTKRVTLTPKGSLEFEEHAYGAFQHGWETFTVLEAKEVRALMDFLRQLPPMFDDMTPEQREQLARYVRD